MTESVESNDLDEALAILAEISERAREMGLGLAKYPVADVERVVAVLSAGQGNRKGNRFLSPVKFDAPSNEGAGS
jgi:hypothetical protein